MSLRLSAPESLMTWLALWGLALEGLCLETNPKPLLKPQTGLESKK